MEFSLITRVLYFLLIITRIYANKEISLITVATEYNDALQRLLRSAENNGFDVKVLGLGSEWKGGNTHISVGGGQKINLLISELIKYKDDPYKIIMFVDGYDIVLLEAKERLMKEYKQIGKKVLFSAEDFCWPDKSLEQQYPMVGPGEKRFLNSGAFMGPASDLYRLLTLETVKDNDDDQLYYSMAYLNDTLRTELDIGLDSSARIFQNLNGAFDEVELHFTDDTGYLTNTRTNTQPMVVHGNGPIKHLFNSLTNYLDYNWTPKRGCQQCEENLIDLANLEEFPYIQMSIFIDRPTPFLELFFQRIAELTYPKNRIYLTGFVSFNARNHQVLAESFNATYGHEYHTSNWMMSNEFEESGADRKAAFAHCLAIENCQFLFAIAGTVQLTNPDTIQHLVHMNRSMLAPLVTRREKLWSNFWGGLSSDGYYNRSEDYVDIVEDRKRGIWNVPFVRDVYLISRHVLRKFAAFQFDNDQDLYMEIAKQARENNIFMMLDNQRPYGYLIYDEKCTVEHVNNDLWQIFDNPLDWEEQYVHPKYFELLPPSVRMSDFAQPCPDVFYFPIVTEKFCKQLIEEMENFGQWSDGSNTDPRLEGGYENVPTRDIHMRQVGWEEHWLHFLVKYIHPIQKKVFEGYEDKPWARMNFVVRYRPGEQDSLRPHHDASSYSLTIALNKPGVAYQGGGTRFVRYNCAVTEPDVGWTTMFPGRVTHLHEGLKTTAGTRYIFVTFVSP